MKTQKTLLVFVDCPVSPDAGKTFEAAIQAAVTGLGGSVVSPRMHDSTSTPNTYNLSVVVCLTDTLFTRHPGVYNRVPEEDERNLRTMVPAIKTAISGYSSTRVVLRTETKSDEEV